MGLHLAFCEWRTLEFAAERAGEADALAMVVWRRVEHAAGNAAAWDARRRELRGYHADWLACLAADPAAAACAGAGDPEADATVRAVAARDCAAAKGLAPTAGEAFRRCLAARGHAEARPPRWTRELFGRRFAGPYVTLSALFAEDFGLPPATGRALGWWRGVLAPAALAAAAGALLVTGRRRQRERDRGAGK